MTINESDRNTLIKYRIEKAKKAADDADFSFNNDRLQMAVNRIYYSYFYILTALALKHRFQSSKHQELIGWFNKTFVKGNIIDRKYGKFLHKAYDKRSKADYADYVQFDKEELLLMINEMNDFIKKVEILIENQSVDK
ncbi:MAG: HEPN domain-containing protein [Candidatus Aminicenantes bacterium]|nr:HEPN domain-containing protein [Candidatus Aminicenantes bacterium]